MSLIKKIETTFCMGIKGGLHYLFRDEMVMIDKIYLDHSKEIVNKNFNKNNIINRLKDEVHKNIKFTKDSGLMGLAKSEYEKDDPNSEFMQLADISVGAIRTQVTNQKKFKARWNATIPIESLLDKDRTNHARMEQSRYFKGFTLSDAFLENDSWSLKELRRVQE